MADINNPLFYWVSGKELGQIGWQSKVLQKDYSTSGWRDLVSPIFRKYVREIYQEYKGHQIDIEEVNRLLQEKVVELELEYPECFTRKVGGIGWYGKGRLVQLYVDGLINLEGYTREDELAYREKVEVRLKAKLAAKAEVTKLEKMELQRVAEVDRLEHLKQQEIAEAAREKVVVGTLFTSKASIMKAYKEVIRERIGHSNQSSREKELKKLVVVDGGKFEGGRWQVIEVLVEGGRKWVR